MVFRPTSALLSVLLGLLIRIPFIIAQGGDGRPFRTLQSLDVGRQNAHLQECVDNMYASDTNGDLALSEEEYVLFIARESEGAILVENFPDLPFSLVIHFVYGACFCSIIFQAPNCCVGAQAAIDLDANNSPFIEDNLITICASVKQAIVDEVGTIPPLATPTPVQVPTIPPTTIPTQMPTTAQTLAPVVQTPSKCISTKAFVLVPLSIFLRRLHLLLDQCQPRKS
jgi:hypothetical protein